MFRPFLPRECFPQHSPQVNILEVLFNCFLAPSCRITRQEDIKHRKTRALHDCFSLLLFHSRTCTHSIVIKATTPTKLPRMATAGLQRSSSSHCVNNPSTSWQTAARHRLFSSNGMQRRGRLLTRSGAASCMLLFLNVRLKKKKAGSNWDTTHTDIQDHMRKARTRADWIVFRRHPLRSPR